jgi:hypothetical protein
MMLLQPTAFTRKRTVKTVGTETREVEVIEDIFCNKCGISCKSEWGNSFYGLIEVVVTGGYESTHLGDMSEWCFSLCEGCLDELFKTFKHDPKRPDWDGDGGLSDEG